MKPVDCLPIYDDGRHYDLQNEEFVRDIPFWLQQVKHYGEPVLEMACGTGRITIPLAQQGIDITGLDISGPMLSHAKDKAAAAGVEIEWVETDCRSFDLGRQFRTILLPYNAIVHIHELQDVESCLSCVKRHLADEGRFVVDTFNPSLQILTRDPSKRYPTMEYRDPAGAGRVVITETNRYDAATQINHVTWYFRIGDQAEETAKPLNMRMFYPQELEALLRYNGFVIDAKMGEYDGSPFTSESRLQLVVCHRCS